MATSRLTNRTCSFAAALGALFSCLCAPSAHAGPAELFSRIVVGPSNPDQLALPFYYGGSGLFLSSNAGTDFGLLCSGAVDASLVREQDVYSTLVSGTGSIHIGGPTGLWTGNKDGCGWTEAAALKGKWVSDIAADPTDPKRSYAVTAVAGEQNGIYENDGTNSTWSMLGTFAAVQLSTLRVAKTNAGKIFYARGVTSAGGTNRYVIRVSEDNAKTWMEYEFGHGEAQDVRIVAVDPADSNRIVVAVVMDTDKTVLPNPPDELWFSPMRGMANSFMKITTVGVLRGAVFGADGALYYGDDAPDSPGLYTVKKLGDMPKQVMSSKPISCLGYDTAKKRMYACSGYEFGTIDPASGDFQSLFDKRKASKFIDCPGQAPTEMRCKEQLTANYCGYGHYWQAPLCANYMLPGSPFDPMLRAGASGGAGGSTATAGAPSAGAMSSPAAAGTAAPATPAPVSTAGVAAMATAGTAAPPQPPAAPPPSKGCSCAAIGSQAPSHAAWLFAAGLCIAFVRRRRAHR